MNRCRIVALVALSLSVCSFLIAEAVEYGATYVPGAIPPVRLEAFNARQVQPLARPPRGPSDLDLAFYHAPIHYQDTDSTNYRADYITRVDYDNNWKDRKSVV